MWKGKKTKNHKKIILLFNSSDSSLDELSNDEDSSAPEPSEVEVSEREEEEDQDKPISYIDGDEKKKADNKSVTVQVI